MITRLVVTVCLAYALAMGQASKHYVAPTGSFAVVTLTDAATIATDVSLANHFRVTLGGNRTLGNPTGAIDGQKIVWEVIQDGTGSRTLAFDTQFAFGTDIASCTVSTTASKRDFIGAIYNSTATKWYVTSCVRGYSLIPDWLLLWAAASWLMRRRKQ